MFFDGRKKIIPLESHYRLRKLEWTHYIHARTTWLYFGHKLKFFEKKNFVYLNQQAHDVVSTFIWRYMDVMNIRWTLKQRCVPYDYWPCAPSSVPWRRRLLLFNVVLFSKKLIGVKVLALNGALKDSVLQVQ